jgi:hypothetical protein
VDRRLELNWDLAALADALRISAPEVEQYFRDGRRISFILERRIRDAHLGWKLAPSEGAGYDLVDDQGAKWEVRSVSKTIYFCPSYMVGSGRKFEEVGFLAKLDSLGGYICSDIILFPKVPVFIVPAQLIRRLYQGGELGTTTQINRERFYARIVPALR